LVRQRKFNPTLETNHISSNSFCGHYSFLNLEIQRSPQYIMPKVTVHKCAETIQGRKLFKGGNYSREETIQGQKLYEEIRRYFQLKQNIKFNSKVQNIKN
jgi:hypothetical protein